MIQNVYAIFDGQAGSCGKGKVCGEFALSENIDIAIANNLPNAGHSFSCDNKKRIFRYIPVSAVNPNTILFIGAGSGINMEVLEEEYYSNFDILDGREIYVHPSVCLIEDRHIEYEKAHIRTGSTFKGCGAYLAERGIRDPQLKPFKGFKNIKPSSEYTEIIHDSIVNNKKILLEGSQGTDLSLYSKHYPHVTGRPVSVAQMFADSEIPICRLNKSIMVIRPFPIRISNDTELGININSGNYGNSKEFSWNQVSSAAEMGQYPLVVDDDSAANTDLTEKTTVTRKPRRIFDIDINQLKDTIFKNEPTSIYLNFFQYLDISYAGVSGNYNDIHIDRYRREYLNWLETELQTPIIKLGTGPNLNEVISITPF